jgi:tetratricopeptide (TPR) repeat protein
MNKQKIVGVLMVLGIAFLGWRVLSLGMADFYAVSNPEKALFWRANHPEASYRMANKEVEAKRWNQAQTYAEQAIRANHLDGRALRVLALVAEHQNNEAKAFSLMNQAVKLSPRDTVSHLWLLDYALRNQQAKPAVIHLDALLQVEPSLMQALMPQALMLSVNPAVQVAMVEKLAMNPPWRIHLLSALASSPMPADQIIPVFTRLKEKAELEPSDYLPLIARLNKDNRYPQAYVTWANLIPNQQRKYLGNVFDGGFELALEEQAGEFAWNAQEINGAQMGLLNTQGSLGENSFYIQFEGQRTAFANLSQLLALPTGKWQVSYRAKAERLDNTRGLIWRIVCQNNGSILAESQPMQGQFKWQELQFEVDVPEQCSGQRLVLMIPARIPAETLISGSIWIDDVKIRRIESIL